MMRFFLTLAALGSLVLALVCFGVTYQLMVERPARDAAEAAIARSTPVVRDMEALQALQPGEEVIIPGQINLATPTTEFLLIIENSHERMRRAFVTYEVLSPEPGANALSVSRRVTPPFLFDVVGGSIPVLNADYSMVPTWGWTTTDRPGESVRGLIAGSPITILGTVTAVDGEPAIQAISVSDYPAEYFRSSHVDPDSRGWGQAFGMLLGMVGAVALGGSLVFGTIAWWVGRRNGLRPARV